MVHPIYEVAVKVGGLCMLVPDPGGRWIDVLIPKPRGHAESVPSPGHEHDAHHDPHEVWLGVHHPSGRAQMVYIDGMDVDLTSLGRPDSQATPVPPAVMDLRAILARALRGAAGTTPPGKLRARARIPFVSGAATCTGAPWTLGTETKPAALVAQWNFSSVAEPALRGCRTSRLPGTGHWASIPLDPGTGPITFFIMHTAPAPSTGGKEGEPNDHFPAFYDLTDKSGATPPKLAADSQAGDLCGEWPPFIPGERAPGYKCILATAEYEP